MNTYLTKEELDEAERIYLQQVVASNEGYDAYVLAGAYWDYGQQLISMARRTLQAEERLGRAEKLLEEVFEDGLKTNSKEWNRDVNELLGGPEAIHPPAPATPPVEPDALLLCPRCHGRGGWEGGGVGETWTECPECN